MSDEQQEIYYVCRVCGFHPENRRNWCASGCGRDYNTMHEVRVEVVPSANEEIERWKETAAQFCRNEEHYRNERDRLQEALEAVRAERAHGLTANSDFIDKTIESALASSLEDREEDR